MTVYLAWTASAPDALDGPWEEARQVAPGLLLIDSLETLSTVYHALKWSLRGRCGPRRGPRGPDAEVPRPGSRDDRLAEVPDDQGRDPNLSSPS